MKGETIRRPEVLDQVMTASLEISDVRPVAFDRFVDEAGLRLRRVLVAHYGVEIGVEVTADALAHAWEHWDRVRVMGNPTGYLYRVAQSSARRYRRWASPPSFPPERAGEALEGEPGPPCRFSPPARAATRRRGAHPRPRLVLRGDRRGARGLPWHRPQPAAPGDPLPLAPHRDLDGCTRGGSDPDTDEGAYQARWKTCVAALAGDIIATGVIGGVPWELLASDEPPHEASPPGATTAHWVTLRAAGLDGMFRGSFEDPEPTGGTGNLFSQLGPCCRLGNETVVAAVTRADVARVRLEVDGINVAEVATVTDPATPWVRYAILGAPATGRARVVFEMANGTTVRPLADPLNLATTGG